MKKKIFVFSFLLSIIISTLLIQLHLYNKVTYLNLSFYNISGNKVDVCKIEVTKDINLGSYEVDTLRGLTIIDDEESINGIIHYLNSIPLKVSNEKSIHTNCGKDCCTMFFYDDGGLPRGWIAIHGDVIQRSKDLRVFVKKYKYPGIVDGLKQSIGLIN